MINRICLGLICVCLPNLAFAQIKFTNDADSSLSIQCLKPEQAIRQMTMKQTRNFVLEKCQVLQVTDSSPAVFYFAHPLQPGDSLSYSLEPIARNSELNEPVLLFESKTGEPSVYYNGIPLDLLLSKGYLPGSIDQEFNLAFADTSWQVSSFTPGQPLLAQAHLSNELVINVFNELENMQAQPINCQLNDTQIVVTTDGWEKIQETINQFAESEGLLVLEFKTATTLFKLTLNSKQDSIDLMIK